MKYLIFNDINYILKNKLKIISIFYLTIIIITLIYGVEQNNSVEIISIATGTNYNYLDSLYIELLILILNISIFLYLALDIYLKDIKYQLDNIFLRYKPEKWFLKKSLIFLFTIICLKFIEYIILAILLLIFNLSINFSYLINIFFLDTLYIIFIQYLCLLCYIVLKTYDKFKLLTSGLILLTILIIPINILSISNYYSIYIIFILLIIGIISLLFKKRTKVIIQKIGGI